MSDTINHLWPYTNPHELNLDWIIATVKQLGLDFETLKKWCEDYLDNLDISNDVNKKINQMVTDGTLTPIVEEAVKNITEPLVDKAIPELAVPLIEAAINAKIGDIDTAITTANNAASAANRATESANSATNAANSATSSANNATSAANSATSAANSATSAANDAAQKAIDAAALINSYEFTYISDPEQLTSNYDIASEIIPKLNKGFPLSMYTRIGTYVYPIIAIPRAISTDTIFYILYEPGNERNARVPHYFTFDGGTNLNSVGIPNVGMRVLDNQYELQLYGILPFIGTSGGFSLLLNVQQGVNVTFNGDIGEPHSWRLLRHCQVLSANIFSTAPAQRTTYFFNTATTDTAVTNITLDFTYNNSVLSCNISGNIKAAAREAIVYLTGYQYTV